MRPPLQDLSGRPARRRLGRAGVAALALVMALLVCHTASATLPAPQPAQSAVRERPDPSVWRGVICTSASCRPLSRWDVAAFAVAVLTVGWLARRRGGAPS